MNHKEKVIEDLKDEFRYHPGYFYRDKDGQSFFQSFSKKTGKPDDPPRRLSGSSMGDPLCMLPIHYLREGFAPGGDPSQELWDKVYADMLRIIETNTVAEYFFPNGVGNLAGEPGKLGDIYDKIHLSYYVIGTKMWEEYESTGVIDEDWLFALACSVNNKSGGLKDGKLEDSYDALVYQILTADTREKKEAIMELLRPPRKGDTITIPCDKFDYYFKPIVFGECSFFDDYAGKV